MTNSGYPSMPAELVLQAHTRLHEANAHPSDLLIGFYEGFLGDIWEKAQQRGKEWKHRAQLAYYPLTKPSDGGKLCGIFAKGLFTARTYQVTADMVGAVCAMYEKTSSKLQYLPRDYQVVSESGFCWLDKPWTHTDIWGKTISVRAITWQPQPIRFEEDVTNGFGQKTGTRERIWDAYRVSTWSMAGDPDDYAESKVAAVAASGYPGALEQAYQDLGPLILLHTFNWPSEMRFGGPSDDQKGDDLISWMWCLWLMLEAEVAVTRKVIPPQARRRGKSRKRLQHGEVNVVLLRRAKTLNPDDVPGHYHIDWTCRWMVAGHYRHLETYDGPRHHFNPAHHAMAEGVRCVTCGSRGTYVKAHLKGPDDMPFRQTKQVWKLAR